MAIQPPRLDDRAFDDLRAELDDVERVQDRGGVLHLVVDGALVAAERIQRRDVDVLAEVLAAVIEPVGVGLLRPAGHQVEQSGVDASVLVTS